MSLNKELDHFYNLFSIQYYCKHNKDLLNKLKVWTKMDAWKHLINNGWKNPNRSPFQDRLTRKEFYTLMFKREVLNVKEGKRITHNEDCKCHLLIQTYNIKLDKNLLETAALNINRK